MKGKSKAEPKISRDLQEARELLTRYGIEPTEAQVKTVARAPSRRVQREICESMAQAAGRPRIGRDLLE
jgi:hypothetical protein